MSPASSAPHAEPGALYQAYLASLVRAGPERAITDEWPKTRQDWLDYIAYARPRLVAGFGFPEEKCPLNAEIVGRVERDRFTVDKLMFDSEPFARVTANLYLPKGVEGPVPCMIKANGHSGSKSFPVIQYGAQTYANLGLACLTLDNLGNEERNPLGRMSVSGHRYGGLMDRALALGRYPGSAILYDLVRAVDYVETRPEVDPERIGVMGSSRGGTDSQVLPAIDTRVRLGIPSAIVMNHKYYLDADFSTAGCRSCQQFPGLLRYADQGELHALSVDHASIYVVFGALDGANDGGLGALETQRLAQRVFALFGREQDVQTEIVPQGPHAHYYAKKSSLLFVHDRFGTPRLSREELEAVPEIPLGEWGDAHGVRFVTDGHRKAVLLDTGVELFDRAELACLPGTQRPGPKYHMLGWIDAVEEHEGMPILIPRTREEWDERHAYVQAKVRELLRFDERPLQTEVETVDTFLHGGRTVHELRHGPVGWTSLLVLPQAQADTHRTILYLPDATDKRQALDDERTVAWLQAGRAVLLLDGTWCAQGDDWTLTLGLPPAELDVKHLLEAVELLAARADIDLADLACYSKQRDAALYAALLDERIRAVYEAEGAPGALEDVLKVPKYLRGLLPGVARHTTRPELLALLAPRPIAANADMELLAHRQEIFNMYRNLFDARPACEGLLTGC